MLCSFQMGYGSRALQLLEQYYEGKIACVSEDAMEEDETNANNGGHIVDDEVSHRYVYYLPYDHFGLVF